MDVKSEFSYGLRCEIFDQIHIGLWKSQGKMYERVTPEGSVKYLWMKFC